MHAPAAYGAGEGAAAEKLPNRNHCVTLSEAPILPDERSDRRGRSVLIRLYLIRHAAGEKRDGARSLTRRGRSRFRCVARAFAELEEPVDLICASPKRYARQTAEILARSMDEEVLVLDELSPRASAASLLRVLAARAADRDGIAIVGHKRQLRQLLAALGLRKRELPLRKGGVLRIDVDTLSRPRASVPRFRLSGSAGELRDAFCGLRRVA
jgi:phosphohistidine phosphatase